MGRRAEDNLGSADAERDKRFNFPWREQRAGVGWRVMSTASLVIMISVVCLGAWWTATAVRSGDTVGTLLRFSLATLFGGYYLVLYRTARVR